ncbi:ester cyclase [Kribbella sp. NPDC023855]|uniref:ester cyclase n=1 Tax=Kribbella sp. NPDC023855 TaxID=3154698 RepID=UPI0033D70791
MNTELNKATARRFFEEVFNAGRLELMDEIASPELRAHGSLPPGMPDRGPAPYKHTVELFRTAFADLHHEIHALVAEGDLVAVHVTMTGRHVNTFLDIPATGRRIVYPGMDLMRFDSEHRLVEHWTATDDLGLLQQLNVLPADQPWSSPAPEQ